MAGEHHHHSHNHAMQAGEVNTAFLLGIVLNLFFVVAETIAGLYTHSLSLLSDAGHNLADVGALGLSLLAYRLAKVKAKKQFTYGYRKSSIIVALFNSVLLLVSIGAIGFEAFQRFFHPQPVAGNSIAIVAGIGILINGATAFMFLNNKEHDLNIKSAYLHMVADAAVSFAIMIGGIVIMYCGWFWIDSALSLIVAVVILMSSWKLLKSQPAFIT